MNGNRESAKRLYYCCLLHAVGCYGYGDLVDATEAFELRWHDLVRRFNLQRGLIVDDALRLEGDDV